MGRQRNARAGRGCAFWLSVCGKHHPDRRPGAPREEDLYRTHQRFLNANCRY
jgi:hypothetical protein